MSPKCEFSERNFEELLKKQLLGRNNDLYSPTQALENHLGFDGALHTLKNSFWINSLGIPTRGGIFLGQVFWDRFTAGKGGSPPKFKANVFIQTKTSSFMTRNNRDKMWTYWQQAHFRYALDKHQQKRLEILSKYASGNAIVLYAAPAFTKQADLFSARNNLVLNSNFVRASKLKNHQKYSYITSGRKGFACSEPSEIDCLGLREELERFDSQHENVVDDKNVFTSLQEHLETISEEEDFREYRDVHDGVFERVNLGSVEPIEKAFIEISFFCTYFSLGWLIYGSASENEDRTRWMESYD